MLIMYLVITQSRNIKWRKKNYFQSKKGICNGKDMLQHNCTEEQVSEIKSQISLHSVIMWFLDFDRINRLKNKEAKHLIYGQRIYFPLLYPWNILQNHFMH
jgi:hypothetical protein